MIDLGRVSRAGIGRAVAAPGGFSWWYCDLLGPEDEGLVLIWFFGLPLLAGSDPQERGRERPGLCMALYRRGAPVLYALQEHAPGDGDLRFDGRTTRFRFGRSRIELGASHLLADIDAPIPGSHGRLVATLRVSGAACRTPPLDAGHAWSPLLASSAGSAHICAGGESYRIAGRAYVDHNVSAMPLAELGIHGWSWGRLAMPTRDVVYYLVDGHRERRALWLSVRPDGAIERRDVIAQTSRTRATRWGLDYSDEIELHAGGEAMRVRYRRLLEDGPFYLRFLIEADGNRGERGRGFAESLAVGRVDVPWQRPLVRMRRHRLAAENSLWLPLFNGLRSDRHRRLLRWWWWRVSGRAEART